MGFLFLIPEWRYVLRRAWSVRLSILTAILTAAEVVVPLFADAMPRGVFVVLAFGTSLAATLARILNQPGYKE